MNMSARVADAIEERADALVGGFVAVTAELGGMDARSDEQGTQDLRDLAPSTSVPAPSPMARISDFATARPASLSISRRAWSRFGCAACR